MKKNTFRSIGVGFLLSAVLVGAYAILSGHIPIEGTTVQSIFDSGDSEVISNLESENNKLNEEIFALESTRNNLNANVASLQEQEEINNKEIISLEDNIKSLEKELKDLDKEESTSEDETSDESTLDENDGAFTIQDGESAEEIAARLEDSGFIDSANEFQELLNDWNLHSVIQTGEYELTEEMTIHEIVSIITHGAYYYGY